VLPPNLAKVGIEGSNPFARSKFSQENQSDKDGPSGPFLLRELSLDAALSRIYALGRKSADATSRADRAAAACNPALVARRVSSNPAPATSVNCRTPELPSPGVFSFVIARKMSAMVLRRQSMENGVESRIEDAIGRWVAGVTNDLRQHRKPSSRDDASEIGPPELCHSALFMPLLRSLLSLRTGPITWALTVPKARRATSMSSKPASPSARYAGALNRADVSASVTVLGRIAEALQVEAAELVRTAPAKARKKAPVRHEASGCGPFTASGARIRRDR
jgi:hypothetical protein